MNAAFMSMRARRPGISSHGNAQETLRHYRHHRDRHRDRDRDRDRHRRDRHRIPASTPVHDQNKLSHCALASQRSRLLNAQLRANAPLAITNAVHEARNNPERPPNHRNHRFVSRHPRQAAGIASFVQLKCRSRR